jgi:uncharacterized FlaG/YvyC family protein
MATREEELEAKVKELEDKLKNATHSLAHAVEKLGGELRFPHHDASTHSTTVVETTTDGEKVITTK